MSPEARTASLGAALGLLPLLWAALAWSLQWGPLVAALGGLVWAAALWSALWWTLRAQRQRQRREAQQRQSDDLRLRQEVERLRAVLDQAPLAVVLCDQEDQVLLANRSARDLFGRGDSLRGQRFAQVLERCPASMQQAVREQANALFTLSGDLAGQEEAYHISRPSLSLELSHHTLYLVTRLTRELERQEVDIWKKVIRVLNHEFNNSLAPLSSLLGSARRVLDKPEQRHRLETIFDTMEGRVAHLQTFLQDYARFARLGPAQPRELAWEGFLRPLSQMTACTLAQVPPEAVGCFDPSQLEQALINLIKNATEAGSPPQEVLLELTPRPDGGALLVVRDRGQGMSDEVMEQATMPFYTTRRSGSGLGLALVREVVDGHGGELRLAHRDGGGLEVHLSLPPCP